MTDQQFWSVVASAFGGGCLGALITGGVNWFINRKNYEDDYYKKIIDRRITAYEKINEILADLSFECTDNRETVGSCHICFSNFNEFIKMGQKLQNISLYMTWISKEACSEILNLGSV